MSLCLLLLLAVEGVQNVRRDEEWAAAGCCCEPSCRAGRAELSLSEAELVLQCQQEVCWAGTCQGCCSVCLEPGRCRGMYTSGFLIPGVVVFLLNISVTECGGFAADQVKESRTDGSHGYPSALF